VASPAFTQDEVTKWQDFLTLLPKFPPALPPGVTYLFRGQADAGWHLTPSLLRTRGIDVTLEARDLLKTEDVALQEFESQAHLWIPFAILTKEHGLVDKWSVMQHYGAPTRLLDWTRSAYVAAYFAVESQEEKPGAVWVVNVGAVRGSLKNTHPNYSEASDESQLQSAGVVATNSDDFSENGRLTETRRGNRIRSAELLTEFRAFVSVAGIRLASLLTDGHGRRTAEREARLL
jgi:hypothetical protein